MFFSGQADIPIDIIKTAEKNGCSKKYSIIITYTISLKKQLMNVNLEERTQTSAFLKYSHLGSGALSVDLDAEWVLTNRDPVKPLVLIRLRSGRN